MTDPAPLPRTHLQRHGLGPTGLAFARRLVERFDAHLHGETNIPRTGGALLVGNHTLFGLDAFPLTALLALHTGRVPRFLAERNLFRIPGLAQALAAVGAVPGERDSAVRLLRAGELVVVYPGGVDDSFKTSAHAYRLQWGERAGFAHVALRAGVPVVPIAATGVDELFDVPTRESVLGRRLFGSTRYDLPLPRNVIPRRVRLDYHAGAPIDVGGDADDASRVERIRVATVDAIEAVLGAYREGRQVRAGG